MKHTSRTAGNYDLAQQLPPMSRPIREWVLQLHFASAVRSLCSRMLTRHSGELRYGTPSQLFQVAIPGRSAANGFTAITRRFSVASSRADIFSIVSPDSCGTLHRRRWDQDSGHEQQAVRMVPLWMYCQ